MQEIIVILFVFSAAVYTICHFVRRNRQSRGCGCNGCKCEGCPLANIGKDKEKQINSIKKHKQMKTYHYRLCLLLAMANITTASFAQERATEFSASITTESSWNIQDNRASLVGLLDAGAETPLWRTATASIGVLTNYNTRLAANRSWTVADDRQTFSNIQTDEQIPLSLSMLGITQKITERFSAFLGVRNMNPDYFASSLTGLFTNSSHGIFPTIADNWNVGNYPVASLCLHLEWGVTDNVTLKNSVYNGEASTRWDEVFRFRPFRDGVIDVLEVGYVTPDDAKSFTGEYHAGLVFGNKARMTEDEDGNMTHNGSRSDCSFYALAEQPLLKGERPVGLLLQGGYAPKNCNDTYGYFGAGLVCGNLLLQEDNIGVAVNRALYHDGGHETAVEITYSIPVAEHVNIQPAFHAIHTVSGNYHVALLRACIEL